MINKWGMRLQVDFLVKPNSWSLELSKNLGEFAEVRVQGIWPCNYSDAAMVCNDPYRNF